MRCGQPRDAERPREVEHVAPGLGRIAESPIGPRNPIAQLALALFAAGDADAADQARRARGAADHPGAAGIDRQSTRLCSSDSCAHRMPCTTCKNKKTYRVQP